ncbi:hypothetical protein COU76_05190 [Candidatus Peregrinibacteria bacterium CG10_big_fil_rev_8_21_14_0_10_49_10]|nr:MAG: hypothetical protein COU76_05190 [Candidatus Peregrinibacteria bacterium CG10_big_fil_rev_8_21_14_0_10_49_10]
MDKKTDTNNVKQKLEKKSKQKKRKSSLMTALDDLLGLKQEPQGATAATAAAAHSTHTSKSSLSPEEKLALKHYEEGIQKTLDIIAPAGMEVRRNEIVLNNTFARTYFVYNWPNYIFPNWLSPTINYDAEMDIAHFIYPVSNKAIMKMLRKKVAEMRSSIRMLEQRGIVRDPTLEAALQDAEELRDLLARGQEKLYQFGMYITVYAEEEEKLKKMEADLESLLGGKLVMTKPAMFQMEHAWLSTLPFCQDELEIAHNMNTSPLAASFPFSSSDLTDDHGIMYGINRHNDSLVIFDRFDLANANATVFATSGAGKSFTVKLEILRSMMLGTEVFIIDPENEYVALAETVGGTYIPMSLQSSNCINPFDLPKAVRGEDANPGEVLRAAIIALHGLFKLMLGTLTPSEDGILDKAILDTYALKDITLDAVDYTGKDLPTMHELVDVLMTTEGGENMAQTLKKYTEGSYAGLFNKQTNVELENQLVVFQIRDLEEALRPAAMYVVLNFLWNRIRADMKRRMLVIDEAWNLMQYDDSAKFLYGLIKRARKYYLGVTTITQDVEDFVNSPYGKPIVSNAQLQILLKQSPTAVDNLQKLFYLTDGEKYLLLNSEVGQGIFFAGNKHVAIQIVASPEESEIITTKPNEVMSSNAGKKEAKREKKAVEDKAKEEKASNEKEAAEKAMASTPAEDPTPKLSEQATKTEVIAPAQELEPATQTDAPVAANAPDVPAEEPALAPVTDVPTDAQEIVAVAEPQPVVSDETEQPVPPVETGTEQESSVEDPFDAIDPMDERDTVIPPPKEQAPVPAEKNVLPAVTLPSTETSAEKVDESVTKTAPEEPAVEEAPAESPPVTLPAHSMYASNKAAQKEEAPAPVAEKAKETTKTKKRTEEEDNEEPTEQEHP